MWRQPGNAYGFLGVYSETPTNSTSFEVDGSGGREFLASMEAKTPDQDDGQQELRQIVIVLLEEAAVMNEHL